MDKLVILVGIHFLALASPGPDFIVVLRSSLAGKLRRTLFCCAGIALGVASHLLLAYFGLSLILSQSGFLYSVIVVIGCVWLINMGLSGLKSQGSNFSGVNQIDYSNHFTAFRDGYLTNLLNPKALVYFVSVISPFVRLGEENILYAAVGFIFTIMTFIWFSFLAVSLNTFVVRKLFEKYACYIDRFFSIVILGLACYMLYHEIQKLFV